MTNVEFKDEKDDSNMLLRKWVLPPHGFIRLVGGDANDSIVVNAARVLQEKEIEYSERGFNEMEERDKQLIGSMMDGRHGTPFEHPTFRFHVCLPIFVAREWQRHRIGSYSEISMRWMKGKERFYVPRVEDVRRVQDGTRKIDYKYESTELEKATAFVNDLDAFHKQAFWLYEMALKEIAPEQARYFLPNTLFTEMQWTVNARALMNFLNLRCAKTAMWEIRQYAFALMEFFKDAMPETAEAFLNNAMVAP